MEWLQLGWAKMLVVYTVVPLALTFTILHGSQMHREMREATRSCFLFLISVLIFAGVCLFLGAVAFFVFASMPLGRFHY